MCLLMQPQDLKVEESGKKRERERGLKRQQHEKDLAPMLPILRWGMIPWVVECGKPQEAGRCKETDSPLSLQKKCNSVETMILAQ